MIRKLLLLVFICNGANVGGVSCLYTSRLVWSRQDEGRRRPNLRWKQPWTMIPFHIWMKICYPGDLSVGAGCWCSGFCSIWYSKNLFDFFLNINLLIQNYQFDLCSMLPRRRIHLSVPQTPSPAYLNHFI